MFGRPFHGQKVIRLVLPQVRIGLSDIEIQRTNALAKFFDEHRASLERELGSAFAVSAIAASGEPQWLVGPFDANPAIAAMGRPPPTGPEIFLDRQRGILVTDGRTLDEVEETYSYLRSLHRFDQGTWKIEECASIADAVERIRTEVQCTYPSFNLRGLNWKEICDRARGDDCLRAMAT